MFKDFKQFKTQSKKNDYTIQEELKISPLVLPTDWDTMSEEEKVDFADWDIELPKGNIEIAKIHEINVLVKEKFNIEEITLKFENIFKKVLDSKNE